MEAVRSGRGCGRVRVGEGWVGGCKKLALCLPCPPVMTMAQRVLLRHRRFVESFIAPVKSSGQSAFHDFLSLHSSGTGAVVVHARNFAMKRVHLSTLLVKSRASRGLTSSMSRYPGTP